MNFQKEQIILITGASSGIGKAIARECVDQGATVIACGRSMAKLEAARETVSAPERWLSITKDFYEHTADLPAWLKTLSVKYGKLWALAHAAGTAVFDNLQLYSLEQARSFFDLNFHTPVLLAKAFADRRVCTKGGAICFITSVAGIYPEKGHLLYGAAKAALASAAKSMSQELASRGLRVNCIAPGIVDTPMQKEAENLLGEAYRQEQLASYPLGFGEPEDIAKMASFLLSSQARWITGQNFVLSGGRY